MSRKPKKNTKEIWSLIVMKPNCSRELQWQVVRRKCSLLFPFFLFEYIFLMEGYFSCFFVGGGTRKVTVYVQAAFVFCPHRGGGGGRLPLLPLIMKSEERCCAGVSTQTLTRIFLLASVRQYFDGLDVACTCQATKKGHWGREHAQFLVGYIVAISCLQLLWGMCVDY